MALMAAAGEITPMPQAAIFADTQAEPRGVYTWLDWLEKKLPFPVIRVTAGDLARVSTTPRTSGRSGNRYLPWSVPVFTLNRDGTKGQMLRQCTDKTKLSPLRKAIRQIAEKNCAVIWIGISTDEWLRAKPSKYRDTEHRWPLLEMKISRQRCLEWMKARGFPIPPRSACSFCPYHNDAEWSRLKTDEPEAFASAVQYERDIQAAFTKITRLSSTPFLHASRKPLTEVDFSKPTHEQVNMFNNECEGMCGV